jgi:hypothetical protein
MLEYLRGLFKPETWQRIESKLQFVADQEAIFVAENDSGQRFDYATENSLAGLMSKTHESG